MRHAVCAFLLLGAAAACARQDTATRAAAAPAPVYRAFTLVGQVEPIANEDATVRVAAFEVLPDGQLNAVGVPEASYFDEDGTFYFSVVMSSPEPAIIVVTDSVHGSAASVVSARAHVDQRIPVPPMDNESTVEALVYLRTQADGLWKPHYCLSELRSFITPALAAAILGTEEYEKAVIVTTKAIVAGMDAWTQMLRRQNTSISDEQLASIAADLDLLQLLSDLQLHADPEAALSRDIPIRFPQAMAGVYAGQGLGRGELAAASSSSAETVAIFAAQAPFPVADQIRRTAELMRIYHAVPFVLEQAMLLGAEPSALQELVEAAETVRAQLVEFEPQPGNGTWVEEAWQPLRTVTEAVFAKLADESPQAVAQQRSSVAEAMSVAKRSLRSLSGKNRGPEGMARAVVAVLLPVVPKPHQSRHEEAVFQALALIELPTRALSQNYSLSVLTP